MTTDKELMILREGNRRFAEDRPIRPHQTPDWRVGLCDGQRPFASILSCSDSRVVPEILFDQGIGDLFVVRIAGNIVDAAGLESLEYSATHLRVPLIVVLGHTRCGALTIAVSARSEKRNDGSHLLELLRPAVETSRGEPGDSVRNAVFANVRIGVDTLRHGSPALRPLLEDEKLRITGAIYDIGTGRVEWLED
ncbi:MAG: hypothetical protein H6Q78_1332 [Candidatus Krumholzibacteriota bacterium]|nr:hypothetical protein [Candidatus Krumholzibacteriota bacterium]